MRRARYDELFQFMRFCITGENHPIRLPEIPMYLDLVVTAEFHHGLSSMVEIAISPSSASTAFRPRAGQAS